MLLSALRDAGSATVCLAEKSTSSSASVVVGIERGVGVALTKRHDHAKLCSETRVGRSGRLGG